MPKFRWGILIPSLIGGFLILGIIRDVTKTYWERRSVERRINRVAEEAAKFLPYKEREAMIAALEGLKREEINPAKTPVEIAEDRLSVTVRGHSQTAAWFAWAVGRPVLYFSAEATVRIALEGGGPVGAVPLKDVLFAVRASEFLTPGAFVALTPAAAGDEAAAQLYAHGLEASDAILAAGDVVRVTPFPEATRAEIARRIAAERGANAVTIKPDSGRLPRVAVVSVAPGSDTGTVVGFAAFFIVTDQENDGKVRGSLMRILLDPDPAAPGPRPGATPRDMGLRRAGQVKVL